MKHIAFIHHYDTDGCVSHAIAKKAFLVKFPKVKTDMKCCGYSKVSAKIKELSKLGNDVFVCADLMLPPEDLKFVLKHWREVYLFDHHLETEKYLPLPSKVGDRFTLRYDINISATAIVYKWAIKEIGIDCLNTPQWRRLVQLTNCYDMWKTRRPEWQDAFDLNELFWHKNFWKFMDRFGHDGFDKFTAYERKVIRDAHEGKMKKIEDAPKEQIGTDAAFIFLPDSSPMNLMEFAISDMDYFFIVYPRREGEPELGLSVRVRDSMMTTKPVMNVNDTLQEAMKIWPKIYENGGGHELAGGAGIYLGTDISEVLKTCKHMYEMMVPPAYDHDVLM